MAENLSLVGALTIANGATDSDVLANNTLQAARRLIFKCPATFTGTITLRGSADENAAFADTQPVRVYPAAVDVTLVAAKYHVVPDVNLKALAVVSSMMEGAARTIQVFAVIEQ